MADRVARHMLAIGELIEEDPATALEHGRAAKAIAGRVGVVREAAGVAAYAAGEWKEAAGELRAASRMSGTVEHLPMIADCERGMGRPERAFALWTSPEAEKLAPAERVELLLVAAGARRDMGQSDAAAVLLLDNGARDRAKHPWSARIRYAYADVLAELGRLDDARTWFAEAAAADVHGETDAGDRLLQLDGIELADEPQAAPTGVEPAE